MRGDGPTPRVLATADSKGEAAFVVKTIQTMEREGHLNPESTVAIIYRTNAQSRLLEEACVTKNIKYVVRGAAGAFYSRREVKDCLCFLRVLYSNGRDRGSLIRAIQTPTRGIGGVALEEFNTYCELVEEHHSQTAAHLSQPPPSPLDVLLSLSSRETIPDNSNGMPPPGDAMSTRAINRFIPFSSQMRTLRSSAQRETVSGLLSTIIDTLDLKTHFDSISKTSGEFEDRWGNVMELCQASERYSDDGPAGAVISRSNSEDASNAADMEGSTEKVDESTIIETPLGNFLDDVSLLTDMGDNSDLNNSPALVTNLMTIHASKGMEFDAVFLVGNEEGTFPTQRAIAEGSGSVELDEERRLCYVAMTRAKTHLIMTWRREVMTFFGAGVKTMDMERSRFLDVLVSKSSSPSTKQKKQPSSSSSNFGASQKTPPNRNHNFAPPPRGPSSWSGGTTANSQRSQRRPSPINARGGTPDRSNYSTASSGTKRRSRASLRNQNHVQAPNNNVPQDGPSSSGEQQQQPRRPIQQSPPPETSTPSRNSIEAPKSPQGGSWGDWSPAQPESVQSKSLEPSLPSKQRVTIERTNGSIGQTLANHRATDKSSGGQPSRNPNTDTDTDTRINGGGRNVVATRSQQQQQQPPSRRRPPPPPPPQRPENPYISSESVVATRSQQQQQQQQPPSRRRPPPQRPENPN
eukprot:scaffold213690_cov47-Attheya_sp.AAC.1